MRDQFKSNVELGAKLAIAVVVGVAVHFHAWAVVAGTIIFFYLRRDP